MGKKNANNNNSIEQMQKDHETESAFQQEKTKKPSKSQKKF